MSRKVFERKIPFNCYLTISQLETLEKVSDAEGKPKAELIREAITEYLARKESREMIFRISGLVFLPQGVF